MSVRRTLLFCQVRLGALWWPARCAGTSSFDCHGFCMCVDIVGVLRGGSTTRYSWYWLVISLLLVVTKLWSS